jgi:hypothetical protein
MTERRHDGTTATQTEGTRTRADTAADGRGYFGNPERIPLYQKTHSESEPPLGTPVGGVPSGLLSKE